MVLVFTNCCDHKNSKPVSGNHEIRIFITKDFIVIHAVTVSRLLLRNTIILTTIAKCHISTSSKYLKFVSFLCFVVRLIIKIPIFFAFILMFIIYNTHSSTFRFLVSRNNEGSSIGLPKTFEDND